MALEFVGQNGIASTGTITGSETLDFDTTGMGTAKVFISNVTLDGGQIGFYLSFDGGVTFDKAAQGFDAALGLGNIITSTVDFDQGPDSSYGEYVLDVSSSSKLRLVGFGVTGIASVQVVTSDGPTVMWGFIQDIYATTKTRDGVGNAITSTTNGAIQAFDVNDAKIIDPTAGFVSTSFVNPGLPGQNYDINVQGLSTVSVSLTGTYTGGINLQASNDGSDFSILPSGLNTDLLDGNPYTTLDGNYHYLIPVAGYKTLRFKNAVLTGTLNFNVGVSTGTQVLNGIFATLYTAQSGTWTVGLDAGSNTIGKLATNSGVDIGDVTLTAGSASIGTLGANSGVDIGDVTINNASGVSAVNIQDGGNSLTVDNNGTFVVQATLAAETTKVIGTVNQGTSPWVTSATLLTGSAQIGHLEANQSVNVAQINGVTPLMGAGNTGTGSHRVTIATDQLPVAVNLDTVNGVDLLAGNGVTGTGSPRVTIASDNTAFNVNAVPVDGTKTSCSAATIGITPAALSTDIFTITGSATKTIRVTRIGISGTQTTAGSINLQLVKRSTANSGGTSTNVVEVSHDSNDTPTATVLAYTVNPTLGNLLGPIRATKFFVPTAIVSGQGQLEYNFATTPTKAIVLRGTGEVLAFNLNAETVTGGSFNCYVEWSEE